MVGISTRTTISPDAPIRGSSSLLELLDVTLPPREQIECRTQREAHAEPAHEHAQPASSFDVPAFDRGECLPDPGMRFEVTALPF